MRDDAADPAVRTVGAVNWLGMRTLYDKEVRRFLKVSVQTVVAPLVQTLLFMAVLTLAWGDARGAVLGVPFAAFLAPGLVMMAIVGNAFANSSSSIIVSKIQGNAVDFLMPPLSPAELTAAFVGGAVTRGLLVGLAGVVVVLPFAGLSWPAQPWAVVFFAVQAAVLMGAVGAIAGVWADKFDHLSAITSFVITPLTFLSGTFYSIAILPPPLEVATRWNPFFHVIDGFRYGFIGVSDGSIVLAALAVTALNLVLVCAVWGVLRSGWRLKD